MRAARRLAFPGVRGARAARRPKASSRCCRSAARALPASILPIAARRCSSAARSRPRRCARLRPAPTPRCLTALDRNLREQEDVLATDNNVRFHELDLELHDLLLGLPRLRPREECRARPPAAASTGRGCSCARRRASSRPSRSIKRSSRRSSGATAGRGCRDGNPPRRRDGRTDRIRRPQSRRGRPAGARDRGRLSRIAAFAAALGTNRTKRGLRLVNGLPQDDSGPGRVSGRLPMVLHPLSPADALPFGDMPLAPFAMTKRTEADLPARWRSICATRTRRPAPRRLARCAVRFRRAADRARDGARRADAALVTSPDKPAAPGRRRAGLRPSPTA